MRWRTWWAETFPASAFWKVTKAAFASPIWGEIPRALIERFAGDTVDQIAALMHLLSPLSTAAGYLPDRRR